MSNLLMRRLVTIALLPLMSVKTGWAHTQKSFVMPRPLLMNTAVQFVPWEQNTYRDIVQGGVHHIKLSIDPVYQHSSASKEIGKYFALGGSNSFTVGERYDIAQDNPLASPLVANAAQVDGALMSGNEDATFSGTVRFDPYLETYGAMVAFEYAQNPLSGLYCKLNVPILSVHQHMRLSVKNDKKVTIASVSSIQEDFNIADFLAGKVSITKDAENMREPLRYGKIRGQTEETGFADALLTIGYRHTCIGERRYAAKAMVIIPTGNRVKSEDLFEAMCGNGKHFGLGIGADAGFMLWRNHNQQLWMNAQVDMTYLFQGNEVRMLGVKGFSELPPYTPYMLMGSMHGASVGVGEAIFPAANQLTRPVKVTPGIHLNLLGDLSWQIKRCVFDVGYNIFLRTKDDVKVRSWEDGKYGIFRTTFNTDADVDEDLFLDDKTVDRENLDTDTAVNPYQVTHTFHTAFTYTDFVRGYPMHAGLGLSYEIPCSNSAVEHYTVWLKTGVMW